MAGELWTNKSQVGVETTYGTSVPATRVMYHTDPTFDPGVAVEEHRFATGTRDNVRAKTVGPRQPSGRIAMPMSNDEILEWLQVSIQGSVTPSVTIWTFRPGAVLPQSLTLELHDGARVWEISGVYGNRINISGSADAANTFAVDFVGKDAIPDTLTAALADRQPTFLLGRQTRLYIDALGATPGTTVISDYLVNWNLTFDNGIQPKFWANNVNAVGAQILGPFSAGGTLTVEGAAAQALTEYNALLAGTGRIVGLRFGPDTGYVDIHLPGTWQSTELGVDRGTRVYQMNYSYMYDSVLGAGFQVKVKSARTTVFGA